MMLGRAKLALRKFSAAFGGYEFYGALAPSRLAAGP